MDLLPKSKEKFASKEYWDIFFSKRGRKAFEWYGEYSELEKSFQKYLKTSDEILVVGCGNSTLSSDLYDVGYRNITSIDISNVVIRQMSGLHQTTRPSLKFMEMDALNMTFTDENFSTVIDKGTLDALMPNSSDEVKEKVLQYFKEINRVTKINGRYICVSLLQENILDALLSYFPNENWMVTITRCFEAENSAADKGQNVFPVFVVICTKFKDLRNEKIITLKVFENEPLKRYKTVKDVKELISNIQQCSFSFHEIRNSSNKEHSEFSFEFFQPGQKTARYIIYFVKLPFERKRKQYAAFVVPQGREVEWLFSTKNGRKHLAEISNYNSLAVITLSRDQEYSSIDEISSELKSAVQNFAPVDFKGKILFLSLGADVGKRTVQYEGESQLSGKYVIEDVEVDNEIFRRLIFLNSQNVIQSEAKLEIVKRNEESKNSVNHLHLASQYHIYLSLGCDLACNTKSEPSVAVIGLGGGSLCMFLKKYLKNIEITGVDLDPEVVQIAQKWFDVGADSQLKLVVNDGIKFIKDDSKNGVEYDCIILDVDSKDANLGISCPPKEFLEDDVVENIFKCIKREGIFLLNLLARDNSMRIEAKRCLKKHFPVVFSYALNEDLNEVVFCFKDKKQVKKIKSSIKFCSKKLNDFFDVNKQKKNTFDTQEFLNKINIEN